MKKRPDAEKIRTARGAVSLTRIGYRRTFERTCEWRGSTRFTNSPPDSNAGMSEPENDTARSPGSFRASKTIAGGAVSVRILLDVQFQLDS